MNSAERFLLTEKIFSEAVALGEPQRTRTIEHRCGGDTTLMAELRSLIAACEAEEAHRLNLGTDDAQTGVAIGPYVIDDLIGRGGMGAVFRAHRSDGQFDQQVAIKIVDMPLASGFLRERFRAERQMLAGLSHRYIARLLDGGVTDGGELYLVMEYIEGLSLTDFCRQHGLLVKDRVLLFLKVCEAVQYAHRNLIVHRDLKPENILVTSDSTPRLLDFGTAKIVQPLDSGDRDNATRPGLQAFTPRYASPEQILGQPISVASDIYSLGVLLYVLLTDEHPYRLVEFSTEELVRVVCGEPARRPSLTSSPFGRIDGDLDSIMLKALRKDPKDRYSTVENLAADLQACLDHRPVEARRGNFRYLAAKFVRRQRFALAGAAVLLMTLLAGIAGIAWQARIANQQRRKAEARSEDLRTLSNNLLSELDDAIKLLPGSTPAQKLIVNRMLQYLDGLEKSGADDQATQIDVANAYRRVGNLLGNPYDQNLGDPLGGLANIEKAAAIVGRLKTEHPRDAAVLTAYAQVEGSRGEMLLGLSRLSAAVEAERHACDIFSDMALRRGATTDQASEAATACGALGDGLGQPGRVSLGDTGGALKAYQQAISMQRLALRLNPDSERAQRGVAVSMFKLGNLQVANDPAEAIRQYRSALETIDRLPPERQTESMKFTRISLMRRLGSALANVQDPRAGLVLLEQARSYFAGRVAADPDDNKAKSDLGVALENEAVCYEDLTDTTQHPVNPNRADDRAHGIAVLQQSIVLNDAALQQNPRDVLMQASRAAQRVRLGMLQQATPQRALGLKSAARGLAELRVLANAPTAAPFVLDQMCASLLLVDATPMRDPTALLEFAKRNVATVPGHAGYRLTLARAYRTLNQPVLARKAAEDGLALLPPSTPGVPMTGNRAWLTVERDKP